MAFGYPNYGSPTVHDYADAKQRWESIKPIRGRAEDTRPLGLRRNTHIQIWKDGDDYKCRLYQTDCVIFKPNGDIVVDTGGWTTTTTASFIGEVLGVGTSIMNSSLWLYINHPIPTEICGNGQSILRRVDGQLVLQNPTKRYAHRVKRKEANIVRSKYKDFRTYLNGILKIRDRGYFSMAEFGDVFGKDENGRINMPVDMACTYKDPTESIAKFLELIDTPESEQRAEAFYMASLMVAQAYGDWLYNKEVYALKTVRALRGLDDTLFRAYRDTVFEKVELTGKDVLKRDANAKYF
jgi:hypothetical protein